MKKKNLFWQIVHMCIIAVVFSCFAVACGEENELPVKPDIEQVGEVEFEIEFDFGGNKENSGSEGSEGTEGSEGSETPGGEDKPDKPSNPNEEVGSSSSPVNVETGDTLSVVVSQNSSYKDPDGSVYSVEPKASIELFAEIDTVYAKDVKTLTTISKNTDVKTTTSGSNPVCYNTAQVFTIGTQEVKFDLMHEIYTYVNSASQAIEMPYIKVNEASFGTANANNSQKSNSSSAITIKKVGLTRASISETNTFEVNVQFNVELEAVHTKKEAKKSVSFNVKYMAVVEDVTELDGVIEYTVDGSVNELTTSNVVTPKEPFVVEINQKSYFAASDTTVGVCNPVAKLSMFASCDTVFVASLDSLKNFESTTPQTSKEGENPVRTTSKYIFNAGGGQSFEFETMYDVFAYDENEDLPYFMFGEPTKSSVKVTALEQTRAIVHDTAFYKVETVFSVPVKSVNAKNTIDKTLNFTVEHIGGVVTTTEYLELDTVIYRKDFLFFDASYNLPDRVVYVVYRDFCYTNGTVKTDSIYSLTYPYIQQIDNIMVGDRVTYTNDEQTLGYITLGSDSTVVFPFETNCSYKEGSDPQYNHIHARRVEVPDPTLVYTEGYGKGELDRVYDFSKYRHDETREYFDENNPLDGWYFIKTKHFDHFDYIYNKENICFTEIEYGVYTLFLYIDGRIIDFFDFVPNIEFKVFPDEYYRENETRGLAKLMKYQYSGSFLGKDVNVIATDTFYMPKKEEAVKF